MPVWLTWEAAKGLLGKLLPHLGVALAVIGALWFIDHRGYQRAMADRDARDKAMLAKIHSDQNRSEQRIAVMIDGFVSDYQRNHVGIEAMRADLHASAAQEIARETRLSNPAAGLTPGLLAKVNAARARGACAAAASGKLECAMPAAQGGH